MDVCGINVILRIAEHNVIDGQYVKSITPIASAFFLRPLRVLPYLKVSGPILPISSTKMATHMRSHTFALRIRAPSHAAAHAFS